MLRQLEIPFDFGKQQADDVSTRRDFVTGPRFLGDAGSSDDVPAFQNENLPTGLGEVGCRDQSVMPGPDDHTIVHGLNIEGLKD